jgi:hypothetical protein
MCSSSRHPSTAQTCRIKLQPRDSGGSGRTCRAPRPHCSPIKSRRCPSGCWVAHCAEGTNLIRGSSDPCDWPGDSSSLRLVNSPTRTPADGGQGRALDLGEPSCPPLRSLRPHPTGTRSLNRPSRGVPTRTPPDTPVLTRTALPQRYELGVMDRSTMIVGHSRGYSSIRPRDRNGREASGPAVTVGGLRRPVAERRRRWTGCWAT